MIQKIGLMTFTTIYMMKKCYIDAVGPPFKPTKCRTMAVNALSAMLPLPQDQVATQGVVKHTMDIIDQVHK